MRKLSIANILKRWFLVAKKVPYKFPNDIPLQLLTLRVVNGWKTKTQKKKILNLWKSCKLQKFLKGGFV